MSDAPMDTHINYSGLVVAGIGFFLTRFTVTLAIYEDPLRFYLAGVVPLVLGLGLAAFGVALAVADVERAVVRTTATWCVVGTATMLVLVVLTLLGSSPTGMADVASVRSQVYLSNFLIGGSVGGTLTGLYASRARQRREELRRQTNRLVVLNRMLRHEVLNAVTVIRGYAPVAAERPEARDAIEGRALAIEETIDEVKYLARRDGPGASTRALPLGPCLERSVVAVRDRHPEATIRVDDVPETLAVRATDRLDRAFDHLLENAVVHSPADDPTVEVSVTQAGNAVRVTVRDEGPGLPESQRTLLETGDVDEFDDPRTGFGLNVVRLLVENCSGSIETDVDSEGTGVTVVLARAGDEASGLRPDAGGTDLAAVRPAGPHLVVTLGAALLAGVCFGVVAERLGGSIGIIGVLYGARDPVVGWVTHEFHSVVFGFVFAGMVSLAPARHRHRVAAHVGVGVAWCLALWFVAAGFVSPIWLRLVGVPAPVPSLSTLTLVSHLVWGASLGLCTALGYRYLTPGLARLVGRVRGTVERT